MSLNYRNALKSADATRSKSLAGKTGTVVVDRILYHVVYNAPRQAYDLMLDGGLQVQLTAFQMAKAKKDAIEWLSN